MVLEYAKKLSRLTLIKGINLQKGDCVLINCSPSTYEYASIMAQNAYELGAKYVHINIVDNNLDAFRSRVQDKDEITYIPEFIKAFAHERATVGYKNIRIDSNEDRIDSLKGDSEKLTMLQKELRRAQKEASDKYMSNALAWCVTCAPGKKWAKQLLGEEKSEEDLAELLSEVLRFSSSDGQDEWEEFDKKVIERKEYLNSLQIKRLHYKSSKTDFTISLSKKARFEGGASTLPDGKRFFANLPTEEIFTTPDMYSASGYITTTKPVNLLNEVTEEITFYFENGSVVDVKAKQGVDVVKKFLSIDEGARRIGEVALVDQKSPISQVGLIFNSILIDENASCHIALGSGYSECIDGGSRLKSDEELNREGINTSLMHVDFMVGSDDLSIVATTYDDREVVIMKDGSFVI